MQLSKYSGVTSVNSKNKRINTWIQLAMKGTKLIKQHKEMDGQSIKDENAVTDLWRLWQTRRLGDFISNDRRELMTEH